VYGKTALEGEGIGFGKVSGDFSWQTGSVSDIKGTGGEMNIHSGVHGVSMTTGNNGYDKAKPVPKPCTDTSNPSTFCIQTGTLNEIPNVKVSLNILLNAALIPPLANLPPPSSAAIPPTT
jgi:hypothetical protein